MSALFRTTVCGTAVAALAIAAALPASAATAHPRATLDAAPSWTAHATASAAASSDQQLSLSFTLKLRNEAGAEALAQAVSTPGNASYRHFTSAATWRSQFAPTTASVSSVESWLKSNGFKVGAVPANHRTVAFTGTVAAAEKAFGTTLKTFVKNGVTVLAPTSTTSVPSSLASLVDGVSGLDTSQLAHPDSVGGPTSAKKSGSTLTRTVTPADQLPPPDAGFKNAKPCSAYFGQKSASALPSVPGLNPLSYAPCGYQPPQLRSAYSTAGSLASGLDGRGVTVAVVDAYASPYILADAQKYAAAHDPQHPLRSYQFSQNLPATFTDTDACDAGGWYGEETLDVEAVHTMAPGANILYVGGSSCNDSDLTAAVNTVVDNQLAQVITNSYGDAGELTKGQNAAEHQSLLQAAAEGISVMFSSGDSGDELGDPGSTNPAIRQPDSPASDPFATAVGGTTLAVGKTGNYEWEQGWGTGKAVLTNGAWTPLPPAHVYGGGGGESNVYAEPWYQQGVVPNSVATQTQSGAAGRTVPDVAMDADPTTGMLVGQSQSFPGGVKYGEYRIGGTSLASPLFAGVTALMDQAVGGQLGFLNPFLYGSLYGSPAVTDVNHGRAVTDGAVRVDFVNGINAKDGLIDSVRTFNQTGTIYTRKGYDDVTGIGTPVGGVLLPALQAIR